MSRTSSDADRGTALVIGGTGPTGPHVVNGLIRRGYRVAMLHTGRHESDEIPPEVEHIHTDPFDEASLRAALDEDDVPRRFDLAVVMYGRLRVIAGVLEGRVNQFISIGGVGAVQGWVDPQDVTPTSLTVPAPDDAPLAAGDEAVGKIRRIVETEEAVFTHHPSAIHLRYPMLYGPRQILPREWSFVRRALDKRKPLILADGGLTLKSAAFNENAANAVMCAVDQAARGQGNTYNVTDERALTIRQIAEVVATELDHSFDYVSLPFGLAAPARPMVMHSSTGHRVVGTGNLRRDLECFDLVSPEEGVRRTVRWLVEHPPSAQVVASLQDPFDYRAEDELLQRWQTTVANFDQPSFSQEPGYGAAYYGREPNPATGSSRADG